MQPAICIPEARTKEANDYFEALRKKQDRYRGGALRLAVMWTLIALFVLFLAFGYLRPAPEGKPSAATAATAASAASATSAASAAWAFRDYLGRVVGALPPECALVDVTAKYPDGARPPLLMAWYDAEVSCGWRNDLLSVVVAFSPDVSPIQKVTLFALILGIVWLRQLAIQRKIDRVSFPRNDRQVGEPFGKRYPGWAEHPVSRSDADRPVMESIYPEQLLMLDPLWQTTAGIYQMRENLRQVSRLLDEDELNAPIDLIIDVIETGAAHGRVGPAAERMRTAVFEFKEEVLGRLWPVDYLLWLLPTIGFIGTIYGISMSLASTKGLFGSQNAFDEEIAKVVDGLAVAFDTTAMALACAAILYLLLKRSEASGSDLADAAEESLANLLIARMVDRGAVLPPGVQIVPGPQAVVPPVGGLGGSQL